MAQGVIDCIGQLKKEYKVKDHWTHVFVPEPPEQTGYAVTHWDQRMVPKMLEKFDFNQPGFLDQEVWDVALKVAYDEYSYFDGTKQTAMLFTVKNVDSTPGYPKKKDFKTERDFLCQYGIDDYLRQHEEVKISGYKHKPLWYAFPKYEIIKQSKIDDCDIRMIMCTDPGFTRTGAMYDQQQNDRMKQHTATKEAQVGWRPFFGGVNERMQELFSDMDVVLELDWTRYDGTLPPFLMRAVRELRKYYLEDVEDEKLLDWYNENLISKFCVLPSGDIIHINKGNPSGQMSTSGDNCIANTILTAYETAAWVKDQTGVAPSHRELKEVYKSVCYGDDRLTTYRKDTFLKGGHRMKMPPSTEFIVQMYKSVFGMWVKPENVKVHHGLIGASFCGMTLKESKGKIVGVYNEKKVLTSLIQPKTSLDSIVDYLCKVYSIAACLVNGSKRTRNYVFGVMDKVKEFCRENGIDHPDLTRQQIRKLWIRPQKLISKEVLGALRFEEESSLKNKVKTTLEPVESCIADNNSLGIPVIEWKNCETVHPPGLPILNCGFQTFVCQNKTTATMPKKDGTTGAVGTDPSKSVQCRYCGKYVQRGDIQKHNQKQHDTHTIASGNTMAKTKTDKKSSSDGKDGARTVRAKPENKQVPVRFVRQPGDSVRWLRQNKESLFPMEVDQAQGIPSPSDRLGVKWTDECAITQCSPGADYYIFVCDDIRSPVCAVECRDDKIVTTQKQTEAEAAEVKAEKDPKKMQKSLLGCAKSGTTTHTASGTTMPIPAAPLAFKVTGLQVDVEVTGPPPGEVTAFNVGEHNTVNLGAQSNEQGYVNLGTEPKVTHVREITKSEMSGQTGAARQVVMTKGDWGDDENLPTFVLKAGRWSDGGKLTLIVMKDVDQESTVKIKVRRHMEVAVGAGPDQRYATKGRTCYGDNMATVQSVTGRLPTVMKPKELRHNTEKILKEGLAHGLQLSMAD
uniref:Non-structural polyprotein 1AB n=1 Tax=Retropinna astrovirus 1 TaxID=3064109 RepID=A0AA49X4I4_9VIRU|nr:MAG: ORF1ab [Retropinna astrovirus 1]